MCSLQIVDQLHSASEQYYTEDTIADPNPLPKVARYNILVRPVPVKKKTKSGIYLPESVKENIHYLQTVGRVVAIGPDCFPEGTTRACEIGDYVVWGRGRGARLAYKGVKFILLVDDEILMTVPAPEDLDENYFVEK